MFSSGYRGPTSYSAISAKLGEKPEVKIANNTTARRDTDGSIVIRLHWTDIVRLHASGAVEIEGIYDSQLTMTRYKAFFAGFRVGIWRDSVKKGLVFGTWNDHNGDYPSDAAKRAEMMASNPISVARLYGWLVPAGEGMRTDFEPTDAERVLHIGARIGNVDAAKALAAMLAARGEHAMAHATRRNTGEKYGTHGRFHEMRTYFEAMTEVAHESGAWLKLGKELVRPLTVYEVLCLGIDPNGNDATVDGVTYDIVDGATWVAYQKSAAYVLKYGTPKAFDGMRRAKQLSLKMVA